eukprot:CAMPEP_0202706094 /NCGR_PEP_ID=MMETSP1385-20130828/18573_1 /ASSEMBLY_ACC=CAM_ASM_000861 /TAXON_ID=933848 /ORGANISM="Elphidium margaritaceum" /LENGTH=301 /DNA_ID=CAMNT_0049364485 /DNA_START=35 /DNA_END=940 /DNA_ORIENTATION=-
METKSALDLIASDNWFSERNQQWPGIAASYKVKKLLVHERTQYQDLVIFESTNHGKVMLLDGVIQLTEASEFIYHEMMVHPALFTHPNPQKILVIGAGDGGVIRELCKHACVQSIDWCEIDGKVIEYAEKYFPQIACSNNDPRVRIHVGDGYKFVADSKSETYDVIITDSSDPVGPAKMLFTKQFYADCCRILKAGGLLASQSECMFLDVPLISELVKNSKEVFKNGCTRYSSMYVPMYPYGQIGCLLNRKYCQKMAANDSMNVAQVNRSIPESIQNTLKYYTPEMHAASFVLPKFIASKI